MIYTNRCFVNYISVRFNLICIFKLSKPKFYAAIPPQKTNKSLRTVLVSKDQRLLVPTKEELKLFKNNELVPTKPIDLEQSIVVRLVKLSDPVTSPLGSTVLFSQYGIKKGETLTFIILSLLSISIFVALGFWQLDRSKWKSELITNRQLNLSLPIIRIDKLTDLSNSCYRIVEATGVLDVKTEFYVGPRASIKNQGTVGYLVISPLRFNDGTYILVNRGWLERELINGERKNNEMPEWVTVRGVVTPGELVDNPIGMAKNSIFKIKNSCFRRNSKVFIYLDPKDIGSDIVSKHPEQSREVVLNAYDILYHDDLSIDPIQLKLKFKEQDTNDLDDANNIQPIPQFYTPTLNLSSQNLDRPNAYNKSAQIVNPEKRKRYTKHFQVKSKTDYLTFYADEHTHVNYAIQWFLMASSITIMMIYKLRHIRRLKKILKTRNDKKCNNL